MAVGDKHWTDDAAIDAWLEFIRINKNRSKRTVEAYAMALRKLREFLAEDGIALLDADHERLEVFTGVFLHKQGVVARSRVPYISAVRGFFAWASGKKAAIVKGNPATGLEHPRYIPPLPRALSLSNAEKLMWAPDMNTFIGIRDAAMLAILVGCGPRVSGVTRLNDSDLQATQLGGEVRLAIRFTEKGGRTRLIPMPKEAEMLVRVYLGHEDLKAIDREILVKEAGNTRRDHVLFVSTRNTKLQPHEHRGEKRRLTRKAIHDMVQRYGHRVGVPAEQLHPHAFRHLFGTELTEEDVSLASTAELMGHVDVKSTQVYIHLAQRRKAATIDRAAPLAKIRTPVSELLKRLPPG
ncbi:MAG: tyrosine-type recombinase/integrase [Ramlibacter sp.]